MHPERLAFVILHDLLGMDASSQARFLSAEGIPTTEGDILTIMSSPLYERERDKFFNLFRINAVRSAGEILTLSVAEAVELLRSSMTNLLLKPAQRLQAAIQILDRVPETSRSLRQFVKSDLDSPITQEMADRMAERINRDSRAQKALAAMEEERKVEYASMKDLIDVK
jgi:hypothetical protein